MQIPVHCCSYYIDVWHFSLSLLLEVRGQSVEFTLETKKGIEARSYEGVSRQLYFENSFYFIIFRQLETLF